MTAMPAGLPDAVLRSVEGVCFGDQEMCMTALKEISDGGPGAVYAAMCGWAEVVRQFFAPAVPADSMWGLDVPADAKPGVRFAGRLLACEMNGDSDTSLALFTALDQDGSDRDRVDAMQHLLATVRAAYEFSQQAKS